MEESGRQIRWSLEVHGCLLPIAGIWMQIVCFRCTPCSGRHRRCSLEVHGCLLPQKGISTPIVCFQCTPCSQKRVDHNRIAAVRQLVTRWMTKPLVLSLMQPIKFIILIIVQVCYTPQARLSIHLVPSALGWISIGYTPRARCLSDLYYDYLNWPIRLFNSRSYWPVATGPGQ